MQTQTKEPMQRIVVEKMAGGVFSIGHKHRGFTPEVYLARTDRGALNAIENLLAGYQPDPSDLRQRPGEPLTVHCRDRPQPRPLD